MIFVPIFHHFLCQFFTIFVPIFTILCANVSLFLRQFFTLLRQFFTIFARIFPHCLCQFFTIFAPIFHNFCPNYCANFVSQKIFWYSIFSLEKWYLDADKELEFLSKSNLNITYGLNVIPVSNYFQKNINYEKIEGKI